MNLPQISRKILLVFGFICQLKSRHRESAASRGQLPGSPGTSDCSHRPVPAPGRKQCHDRITGNRYPAAPSANGSAPAKPPATAPKRERLSTWISGMRTWLIVGVLVLTVVLIFIIQNPPAARGGAAEETTPTMAPSAR